MDQCTNLAKCQILRVLKFPPEIGPKYAKKRVFFSKREAQFYVLNFYYYRAFDPFLKNLRPNPGESSSCLTSFVSLKWQKKGRILRKHKKKCRGFHAFFAKCKSALGQVRGTRFLTSKTGFFGQNGNFSFKNDEKVPPDG